MIPNAFLDELVARTDISEVVGSYVNISKRNGGNLFGLCPFHNEKTPSFSVNSDRQIYHCFGCGKGGGVIGFIMEIENVPFADAVEILAKRAGMTVPDDSGDKIPEELVAKRNKLLTINRDAARFFHDTLLAQDGAAAVQYLSKRGISKAIVTRFGLGAAPDSWDALLKFLSGAGYTADELLAAGLIKKSAKKADSFYDTFRNRLMFPVIDVRGNVIGFSGRILGDGEPKYLNSPDTPVFSKSRNLFGLNLAKKSKSGHILLVEGNIDVTTLHQSGFDFAVASLGTALTEDQVKLLSRYTDNIIVGYDADEAGVKASARAITLLEKSSMNIKVLRMHGAKDPDEFLQKFGADAFRLLLGDSENHIAYKLEAIREKAELSTDDGKLIFLAKATELIATLQSAPEREIYGRRAAESAGISYEAAANEIEKARRILASKRKKQREQSVTRPVESLRTGDKALRYDKPFSAVAEEGIVRILVNDPTLFETAKKLCFSSAEFTSPFLAGIYEILERKCASASVPTAAALMAVLPPPEAAKFSEILLKPESAPFGSEALRDYIDKIRTEKLKNEGDISALYQKYREKKGLDS